MNDTLPSVRIGRLGLGGYHASNVRAGALIITVVAAGGDVAGAAPRRLVREVGSAAGAGLTSGGQLSWTSGGWLCGRVPRRWRRVRIGQVGAQRRHRRRTVAQQPVIQL